MSIRVLRSYVAFMSGRAEYLFIHIPKNAGVSIRQTPQLRGRIVAAERLFLRDRTYVRDLLETMRANGEHHGIQHARLRDVRPAIRSRLKPFAVVRNPWARVVSRFTFAEKAREQYPDQSNYAAHSFEAFLEERHTWGGRPFYWHRAIRGWYPQVDYVVDEAGEIAADLLRLEHLDVEAPRYFGLSEPLPRRNRSGARRQSYMDYYDARTIQIVADWYRSDIERFGFDFDTGAIRNTLYAQPRRSED